MNHTTPWMQGEEAKNGCINTMSYNTMENTKTAGLN